MNNWELIHEQFQQLPIETLLYWIDDAQTFGFEFIIQDGKIYMRE